MTPAKTKQISITAFQKCIEQSWLSQTFSSTSPYFILLLFYAFNNFNNELLLKYFLYILVWFTIYQI